LRNKPTRFYSNRQEKKVAKAIKGKKVANSGATAFQKGDVQTDNWLIECKTTVTEKASFSIKREWLEKNKEEAFAMGKDYNALAFDYGDGRNWYIIDEKTFKEVMEVLNGN
jgi:hypothetical protein